MRKERRKQISKSSASAQIRLFPSSGFIHRIEQPRQVHLRPVPSGRTKGVIFPSKESDDLITSQSTNFFPNLPLDFPDRLQRLFKCLHPAPPADSRFSNPRYTLQPNSHYESDRSC